MSTPIPAKADTWSRLASPSRTRTPATLPPLSPSVVLSQEQEAHCVQRLAIDSVAHKAQTMGLLEKRIYGDPCGERNLVKQAEVEQLLSRMYGQGPKDKDEALQRLRARYMSRHKATTKKFQSRDEQRAAIARLAETPQEMIQRAQQQFDKWNPKPRFLKRTADDRQRNHERYYVGGFGKRNP